MSRLERPTEGLVAVVADNPGPLTLDGTRSYLVGGDRPALIDPGPDDPEHLDAIARTVGERAVAAVCLTHAHADHAGGARAAAAALDAPVAASPGTLDRLRLEGRVLRDGDAVEIDGGAGRLEALETPGHSEDHLCFLWRPPRALFTGDLVLGRGSSLVGHPDGSVGACLASLARLAALRPGALHPGHGPPVDAAVRKLEEYRAHRLERDEQVLAAVRDRGARSVAEIREAVYGPLTGDLARAAELSVRAHLVHLREVGHELPDLRGG